MKETKQTMSSLVVSPKMELVLRQRALSSANNRQLPISHYIEYYAAFRQVATSVDGDSFAIGQALTNNAQGGAA